MSAALDIELLLSRLRQALPEAAGPYALHEPTFRGREWDYVKQCLDSTMVSSVGEFVSRFERELAAFTGIPHAVATVNGTAALHLCLRLAGVKPDDEVIVPALTFVATANAVAYCHAIPHFADNEERTLGLAPGKLADHLSDHAELKADGSCYNRNTGRRIAAVVAMHTFGHPVDLPALKSVCDRWQLPLIEDAAESLGSYLNGKHTGCWGRLAALSFNGNKTITTGGGGAILTSDPTLAARAKHLSTTAKRPHAWEFFHDEVGFNYRLPNINAAVGCAQLEQLPDLLARKRKLAELHAELLNGIAGVRLFQEPAGARSNYWLNVLLLDNPDEALRDRILAATHAVGIHTRPAWELMPKLPMYQSCPRMELPVAESLARRLINLPSSPKVLDVWKGGRQ